MSSPSTAIKANRLVIRYLNFWSVRGDLQEGHDYGKRLGGYGKLLHDYASRWQFLSSQCQFLPSRSPLSSSRAQNWGFCALLPVSFSRWWFLAAPSRAGKKPGTKKNVHKENCARKRVCSRRESNPYGHFCPQDFKSCVSTYSTTRAVQI